MSIPLWFKRNIVVATTSFEHDAVSHVQRAMGWPVTGEMDDATVSHLRGLQMLFGLNVTGVLDGDTAEEVERIRCYYSVQE